MEVFKDLYAISFVTQLRNRRIDLRHKVVWDTRLRRLLLLNVLILFRIRSSNGFSNQQSGEWKNVSI